MATQIATDNFNRANNSSTGMNLGSNWTTSVAADLGIISNTAYSTATSSDNAAFWSGNVFLNDQYSQVTITAVGALGYAGVIVRASASDHVICQQDAGSTDLAIYWYNGGAYTQIGSTYTTASFTAGDVARAEVDGNTYTLYQNGVSRVSGTNSSAPSFGSPGILMSNADERMDDWSGGNLYNSGLIAKSTGTIDSIVSGSYSLSLTIPSGYSNVTLVATTRMRDSTDADRNISSIVWNGSESLTQMREDNVDAYDLTTEQWACKNPTTGTYNAVVTLAGSGGIFTLTLIALAGIGLVLPDASNGASAATGHPTVSVTTVGTNCIVIDSLYTKDAVTPTVGSGQAIIHAGTVNGGGDGGGVSYERKATAGAVTMSWTQNLTTEQWVTTAVSYPEAKVVSKPIKVFQSINRSNTY